MKRSRFLFEFQEKIKVSSSNRNTWYRENENRQQQQCVGTVGVRLQVTNGCNVWMLVQEQWNWRWWWYTLYQAGDVPWPRQQSAGTATQYGDDELCNRYSTVSTVYQHGDSSHELLHKFHLAEADPVLILCMSCLGHEKILPDLLLLHHLLPLARDAANFYPGLADFLFCNW